MKKNKIIKAAVITLGVITVLGIAGSAVMGCVVADKILHQNADEDTHDNSIKQLEVWGYDINSFSYEGQEVSAMAEDGNEVPGTYFDSDSNKLVILVHGAGGDRYSIYPLAEQYIEDGYDVIAIDQRGCGTNPDDKVTFGIKESLDIKAMVRFARTELNAEKVIVHGQSMGAQTTAVYASNVTPGSLDAADAVICDSPVPGMELMLNLMFGDGNTRSLLANYLTGTSKIAMRITDGIDYDDADTIEVVKNDKIPTMIIVSDKDEVCLPQYVEKVYDNIACDKKEILHVNSAHIEGIFDDANGYMDSVESFLNKAGI